MIHTSRQLKAMVRNLSKGDSMQAQILIRNYIMERFLERLSLSPYQGNFILKGGILVSAMVGIDTRSTMDIDATIKNLPLSAQTAESILAEIISVPIDDGVLFKIESISEIMDEAEYSGIRASMMAFIDTMRTPLKLDISTGDRITPREIEYQFKLMFEDRSITVLAYNLETVLAEKLETVLSRGTANTRLRDFYDLYILQHDCTQSFDVNTLSEAFRITCAHRNSQAAVSKGAETLHKVRESAEMQNLWTAYQQKFSYAEGISWEAVMDAVCALSESCISKF